MLPESAQPIEGVFTTVRRGRFEELPLRVVHVVDAMGGEHALWGKERFIQALMREQRASGDAIPELICFQSGRLARELRSEGFLVTCLEEERSLVPGRDFLRLRAALAGGPEPIVHTHSYKANILGRMVRLSGVRMRALVATCHGWDEQTGRIKLYNRLDRGSARFSDVVTVPDDAMRSVFPAGLARVVHVANAVSFQTAPTAEQRRRARERYGFERDAFVVGVLGRISEAKGALDILAAARATADRGIVWAMAGSGELVANIRAAGLENVRLTGYLDDSADYLAALDVYVQASHREGLSLALLEAMRARLPSVATRVGSTAGAVRSEMEGLLYDPGDIESLVEHVLSLKRSPSLRLRLGAAARIRFEEIYDVRRQHKRLLELYRLYAKAS